MFSSWLRHDFFLLLMLDPFLSQYFFKLRPSYLWPKQCSQTCRKSPKAGFKSSHGLPTIQLRKHQVGFGIHSNTFGSQLCIIAERSTADFMLELSGVFGNVLHVISPRWIRTKCAVYWQITSGFSSVHVNKCKIYYCYNTLVYMHRIYQR